MMEHWYWQPLGCLCILTDKRSTIAERLSDYHCDAVRATPSFQR